MKKVFYTCILCCLAGMVSAADLTVAVTHPTSGLNNGAINLTVSGGVAPFAYSWSGTGGFNATTEDVSGLAAGTYTVTVTDNYCGIATLIVHVTGPTGIDPQIKEALFLTVFPNPAREQISITTSGLLDKAVAKLMSVTGQTVMEKHNLTGNTFTFDISGQASGMYFIEIKNAEIFSRTTFLKNQ